MSEVERTLAADLLTFFRSLTPEPNRKLARRIAERLDTTVGSEKFFLGLAHVRSNCDQLEADIRASHIRPASKELYVGAIQKLSSYLDLDKLINATVHELRAEGQALQHLTLMDDILPPLDFRSVAPTFLEELQDRAGELLKQLIESDIESRLKRFLQMQIEQFIWSVRNYDVLGIEGVTKAWGAMASEIARSRGMQGASKPEAKKWYSKALPVVGALGLAVTSVSASVEHVDNALTHGTHIFQVLSGASEEEEGTQSDKPEEVFIVDEPDKPLP